MCLSGFLRLISKKKSRDVETSGEVHAGGCDQYGNLLGTVSAEALLRLRPDMASDEHDFSGRWAAILVLAEDKGTGIKPLQKSCSLHNKAGSRVCEGFGVQRCFGVSDELCDLPSVLS